MTTVLGLWHLVLEGGQEKNVDLPASVQITNVSLGEEIADSNGRTVVKLSFESLVMNQYDEDEETEDPDPKIDTTVLCALTPGKIENASVHVTLDADSPYSFQAVGKNKVYLTGNYIRQIDDEGPDSEFGGSEDSFDAEDAYDLREVSSDVEMHPDDLADLESNSSRFEEVAEEASSKTLKRPRDPDVAEDAKHESASATKKKNKKLKAEGGSAVSAPADDAIPKKDKKKKDKKATNEDKDKPPADTKEQKDAKGEKSLGSKKTVGGGVVIQDAKVGGGPMAKKGNTVRMRYVGKLTNGKEFDKNVSGKPFTFQLGKGEVIKGWDEGIVGMQVGGERVLTIPSNMAYGSKKQDRIPANSTLVFEVKLLEIK